MQLQLASQQGIFVGPAGRLGVDDGGNSHMVRRHGVLPERMVTREMLKQVFNLPIEEAAKHLGIGQTMLKHYCRKFGIPRWPYRKRQSVVQLITSIEEYAQRLRQAFFKEAYKSRMRGKNESDDGRGRGSGGPAGRNGGRTEAWLENLCQAIVDSHPDPPAGGDDGGLDGEMGDGDDADYGEAAEQHGDAEAAAAAAAAALDPTALAAVSMAAVAQLAGVTGSESMAVAAAAAAAMGDAHHQQQQHDAHHHTAGMDESLVAAAAHAQQMLRLRLLPLHTRMPRWSFAVAA
ncbi:RWP-RK domain-containing protein [Scenedesmus sp. NREL 46B-D3]|nr:RWP-RK domain-containing protein [Scenedesmus sp. NREL 46B-D3]